jgi:hypothetical protein
MFAQNAPAVLRARREFVTSEPFQRVGECAPVRARDTLLGNELIENAGGASSRSKQ